MDRPLRVALLSYRSKPHCGGQGIYLRHLSRELAALGHQVEVISGQPYPELDPGPVLRALPSLDLYAMNLFLERRCDFDAYIARLQHLAGERPLLVSESGLDAASHGETEQAVAVDWQIRSAFEDIAEIRRHRESS